LVDEAAEDRAALDPLLGEAGDGFAGLGRAELAAARGSSSVVVGGILGEDGTTAQVASSTNIAWRHRFRHPQVMRDPVTRHVECPAMLASGWRRGAAASALLRL